MRWLHLAVVVIFAAAILILIGQNLEMVTMSAVARASYS